MGLQWGTVGGNGAPWGCNGAQWGAMGRRGALPWGCSPISAAVGSLQDSKRFGAHIRGALMDIAALLGAPQQ